MRVLSAGTLVSAGQREAECSQLPLHNLSYSLSPVLIIPRDPETVTGTSRKLVS